MTRNEALYICYSQNVCIKLDWWDDFMYIYFDSKSLSFKSGPGCEIELDFLLPGNYEILENKYKYLGGLFAV
ncbi:hypothetical protein [Sulfurimonas sp. NWX367]|uniref:hypothetical protein n=1 Tax=unclassified Sulfurimonas TaxID=2623549 RepID=UPI0032048039